MWKRDLKTGLMFQMLLLTFAANGFSAQRVTAVGARETALSLATVALASSFSLFHNQAFLTENKVFSSSLSYRQPFSIQGYHESALSVVCPIPSAVVALGLSQSAIASYHESSIGIAIAKRLTARFSAGLLFNYFSLNLPEMGSHLGSIQVDGGFGYLYSGRLSLGLHVRNILFTKAETFQHVLAFPKTIRGGATIVLSEQILLTSEAFFENETGTGIRLGTEFKLLENFQLRGGISSNPFQHSFGFGYHWNLCQIDFSVVHHEQLGFTPMLSFTFNMKK